MALRRAGVELRFGTRASADDLVAGGWGKSTGWILKARLRTADVAMTSGVAYDAIDDVGLHYTVDGERRVLEVDHVIVCAGQASNRTLHDALVRRGLAPRSIGGAHVALELDALRAIDQATRLAHSLRRAPGRPERPRRPHRRTVHRRRRVDGAETRTAAEAAVRARDGRSLRTYSLLISTRRASASALPAPASTNTGGRSSRSPSETPAAIRASRTASARLFASSSFFAASPVRSV